MKIEDILAKSRDLQRLSVEEASFLIAEKDPIQNQNILKAAGQVKKDIYGNRIVFFAPLYISNYCINDCLYCAFRSENKIIRNYLTIEEIKHETELLIKSGHKRILLVAGESYPKNKGLKYILDAIDAIYSVRVGKNRIRRINVNIAPLEIEEFKELKAHNIGTYQLFQEAYHKPTYKIVHPSGPKSDYEKRIKAIDKAFEAGIDDVGIGVLYGLYDWRYETIELLKHIEHLEKKFGMGPHTISIPRLEPASGSSLASNSKYKVSDEDFKKIIAVLRLAVPYTGIILSTRENAEVRQSALQLGVSQISAGSKTNPGGYSSDPKRQAGEQFSLGDHRSLDEVICDILKRGFIPSFCTACYRLGRTGLDFMEYAKPGEIKKKCDPNALLTFAEYLNDFASPKVKEIGVKLINEQISKIDNDKFKNFIKNKLELINHGERDIFL
ncbi:[FeFe] hydrogenase H-cluster radical SAM maturase HydG [Candidatus Margulisiibacteriota bacterium]